MCCRCCGVTQQKVWVFGFGTLFAVSGLVFITWWPNFIDEMIMAHLPLTPTSKTYDKWSDIPIPIYVYMYLWNWTNAEEVKTAGVKPNFDEVGPYVYREVRTKEDLVWHENNTVSFRIKRNWFWEPELSGGLQTDIVTAPHLPSLAAAHFMKDSNIVLKALFNTALNNNGGKLYATYTASEWIFDGFYDEFLHYAMSINNSMTGAIETDYFAWMLNRNGSTDYEGVFTIHTGVGDIKEMGEIKFWNGLNHTGFYEGECGRLNGSTSDLFVPDEPIEKAITLFVTDTCRIINLEYTGEAVEIEGITGYKYEATRNTYDNGQLNEEMKCYCPIERQPDNCPASGATDLSACANGAPMYMSAPHFKDADPSYAETITGFDPQYDGDNYYMIMERKLGVPMQVKAVVMISLFISGDSAFTILKNVPDFYAPLFTISSSATIDKALASELKLALNLGNIGLYTGVGMLCLGCILIIIGVVLTVKRKWYGQAEADKALNRVEPTTTSEVKASNSSVY